MLKLPIDVLNVRLALLVAEAFVGCWVDEALVSLALLVAEAFVGCWVDEALVSLALLEMCGTGWSVGVSQMGLFMLWLLGVSKLGLKSGFLVVFHPVLAVEEFLVTVFFWSVDESLMHSAVMRRLQDPWRSMGVLLDMAGLLVLAAEEFMVAVLCWIVTVIQVPGCDRGVVRLLGGYGSGTWYGWLTGIYWGWLPVE